MIKISDRVKQSTLTEGVGDIVFDDNFSSFVSFADGVGDGNETYYVIENFSQFEVGIGTYSEFYNSLSRDTVLSSSSGPRYAPDKINLVGVSMVFVTLPANKGVTLDPLGYIYGPHVDYAGIIFPDGTIQTTAGGGDGGGVGANYYVNEVNFSAEEGKLTLGRIGLDDLTADLNGRFLDGSGVQNSVAIWRDDDSRILTSGIINESQNTIGINTPAQGGGVTAWFKNINDQGSSWIINESTSSTKSVAFEARENGTRLGAMYSYGTAYAGGSIATVGSGGVAFSNYTGPVAVGPLLTSKDLIFGAGNAQYAKFTNTEFRINHDGLNRDFRVEGTGTQDLIVADASTDRVGIGVASPKGLLDVCKSGQSTRISSLPDSATYPPSGVLNIMGGAETRLRIDTGFNYGSSEIGIDFVDRHNGVTSGGNNAGAINQDIYGQVGSFVRQLRRGTGGNYDLIFGTHYSSNTAALGDDAVEKMRLTGLGGLLIGMSDPATINSNRLQVEGGNIIFNQEAGAYDFKVSGDSDVNLFSTDGSADTVNVGVSPAFDYYKFMIHSTDKQFQQIIGGYNVGTSLLINSAVYDSRTESVGFYSFLHASTGGSVGTMYHFRATPHATAAGTITSNIGFYAGNQLAQSATNAYGFYSAINAGLNYWNLYCSGTANNYLEGSLGIGITNPNLAGADKGIHIHATNYPEIKLTNDATEDGAGNGTAIQVVNNTFRVTNRQPGSSTQFYNFDSAGISRQRLALTPSVAVFNEIGENVDFRVEGNSDPYLIYADASSDSVNIGTYSHPNFKLSIAQNFNLDGLTTGGSARGIYADVDHSVSINSNGANTTKYTIGVSTDARQNVVGNAYNIGYVMGVDAVGVMTGSGRLNSSIGIRTYAGIHTDGTGTVDVSQGVYSRVLNLGAGVMTSAFAFYGDIRSLNSTYGGEITNAYGLYLTPNGEISSTNSYGVYQAGIDDKNFFYGSLGVGHLPNFNTPTITSSAGNNPVKFVVDGPSVFMNSSKDDTTVYIDRYPSRASIKSRGNNLASRWMIIESAGYGSSCALNYFTNDNILLAYGGGNVGIGTRSPGVGPGSYKLRVTGGHSVFDGGNFLFNDDAGNHTMRVEGTSDQYLLYTQAATNRVAIGTSSPSSKLHVVDNTITDSVHDMIADGSMGSTPMQVYAENESNTNESPGGFQFSSTKANGVTCGAALTASSPRDGYGWSPDIILSARANIPYGGATWTKRLVISSRGKVSIPDERTGAGSDAEDYKFQVYDSNPTASGEFFMYAGTSAFGAYIRNSGVADSFLALGTDDTNHWTLLNDATGAGTDNSFAIMRGGLSTNDTKFLIDNNGNIGLGTDAPSRSLHHLGDTAYIASSSSYALDISASAATLGNNRFQLLGTETVFNQAGANYDFRVEGATKPNLLFCDASQDKVGIGTASPTAGLEIDLTIASVDQITRNSQSHVRTYHYDNSNLLGGLISYCTSYSAGSLLGLGAGSVQLFSNEGDLGILTYGVAKDIVFGTNNIERARITSGGNFGIGTDSPDKQLMVRGNTPFFRLEDDQGGSKRLDFWIDSSAVAHIDANQSASQITFRTLSTDRLRIANDGKVGINTVTPSSHLEVVSDGGTLFDGILSISDPNNTGTVSAIKLHADDGFNQSTWHLALDPMFQSFNIRTASNVVPEVVISPSGALGVSQDGVSGKRFIAYSPSNVTPYNTYDKPAYSFSNDHDTGMWCGTANELSFSTAGLERMRIKSNGDLCLGRTASHQFTDMRSIALDAPVSTFIDLYSGGTARFRMQSASTYTALQTLGNTPIRIKTNQTERMRISETGYVGIGTTSPAYRLDVNAASIGARIYHTHGQCGLNIVDTADDGIRLGQCAYSVNATYSGMTHTDYTGSSEYMIISRGDHTFISAKTGFSSYVRSGNNGTTYQMMVTPSYSGFGSSAQRMKINSQKVEFNVNNENYDFQVNGSTDGNIFVDASTNRVGIGTITPAHTLHVDGSLHVSGDVDMRPAGFGINYATPDGWVESSTNSNQAGYYGLDASAGRFLTNGDGNKVEYGELPNGTRGLIWKSEGNESWDLVGDNTGADGGWNKDIANLSKDRSYISIVYVKRTSSSAIQGYFYHGAQTSAVGGPYYTKNLDGTENRNPYFHVIKVNNMPLDVWCVSIGIIHAADDPITTSTGVGGIYRLDNGSRLPNYYNTQTDYRMGDDPSLNPRYSQRHRTYLYYDHIGDTELEWCWPGFYETTSSAAANILNTILYDHFSDRDISVNVGGGNYDFSVGGVLDPFLIFADASQDKVSIGSSLPSEKLSVTTTTADIAGFHTTVMGPGNAVGDFQSLKIKDVSDSITTEHWENIATNGSRVLQNLIHYDSDFISIDGAYTTGLGTTFDPKLVVNTNNGNVGIGTSTPAHKLDVIGMGRFVHADGDCGLIVEDTGGSGIHLGDCAYLTGSTYTGMKHSAHTNSSEYMIISRGDWTLISGQDGYGSIIRGGNNNASSEIRVYDATSGTNGVVINEQGSDVDTRIEGLSDQNLFKVDASTDRIGIGTATPAFKLDVEGDAEINKIQIGSQAYSAGSHTQGITHVDYDDDQSYMIISDGDNTYTSCHNLSGFNYMRGPQNSSTYQVVVGNSYMFIGTDTTERMTVGSTETVFNQDANNYDFRVEGDTDANLLFLDASTDRIGIGTNSPAYKLDVNGTIGGTSVTLGVMSGFGLDIVRSGSVFGNTVFTDLFGNITFTGQTTYLEMSNSALGGQGIVTMNPTGGDQDFRVEGDSDTNLIYADASTDKVGIGTDSPTQKLDIDSDSVRLRDDKTPASANAAGDKGQIAWDSDYVYVCVATNTWKRSSLSTW